MTNLADEKYLSFTTFRKNGERKSLPVWVVGLDDGTLGFTTGETSWKVKRLANDDRCEVQPCNSRGVVTPGSTVATGTARMVQGAEFDVVDGLVAKKYGIQRTAIQFMGKIATLLKRADEQGNAAIIITLD